MTRLKQPIQEGQLLWAPRLEFCRGNRTWRAFSVAALARGIVTADYESLWRLVGERTRRFLDGDLDYLTFCMMARNQAR